jgi:hypothetical protein
VDIRTLAQSKYKEIDWDALKALTESKIEFQRMKSEMDMLHKMQLRF